MSFWTNKDHRTVFDDAEDLAYGPSGGPVKMWCVGAGIAAIPITYGIRCLTKDTAHLFGKGSGLDVHGPAATGLAIAYISIGLIIHGHWFWGLHPKGQMLSPILKLLSTISFIISFGYALFKIASR